MFYIIQGDRDYCFSLNIQNDRVYFGLYIVHFNVAILVNPYLKVECNGEENRFEWNKEENTLERNGGDKR